MYFSEWKKIQEELNKKQLKKSPPNEEKTKRNKVIDRGSEHYPTELV